MTQTGPRKTLSNIATPNATITAGAEVQKIGYARAEVVGFWSQAVQYYLSSWLPEWMLARLKVRIIKRATDRGGKE